MRNGVTPIFFGTQSARQKVIFGGQCQEKRACEKVKKVSQILFLHFLLSLIPPPFLVPSILITINQISWSSG